jgi:nucleoside-triphosphatase THEP1
LTRRGFALAPCEAVEAIWKDAQTEARAKVQKVEENRQQRQGFGLPDVAMDPSRAVTCMQTAFAEGPKEGSRNRTVLRLVSWMRRNGMPLPIVLLSVQKWAEREPERDQMDLLRKAEEAYHRGYAFNCHDEVMNHYCSPRCIYYKKKNLAVELAGPEKMMKDLLSYLRNDKLKAFNLAAMYGEKEPYLISPGEVVMVTGDTGLGKSTLVQNWVEDLGKRTVYLNLEMSEKLTFRRFLQMKLRMSKDEVERHLLSLGEEEAFRLARDTADHIRVLSIAPELKDLEKIMIDHQPELLVVDTTDGISVEKAGSNEMAKLGMIVEEMRRIAQEHDIVVVGIHHINKSASRDGQLDLNSLTGNRSNVTKVDHVIGIEGERASPSRLLRTMKTRDGNPLSIPLVFNTDTFRLEASGIRDNPWNHL